MHQPLLRHGPHRLPKPTAGSGGSAWRLGFQRDEKERIDGIALRTRHTSSQPEPLGGGIIRGSRRLLDDIAEEEALMRGDGRPVP